MKIRRKRMTIEANLNSEELNVRKIVKDRNCPTLNPMVWQVEAYPLLSSESMVIAQPIFCCCYYFALFFFFLFWIVTINRDILSGSEKNQDEESHRKEAIGDMFLMKKMRIEKRRKQIHIADLTIPRNSLMVEPIQNNMMATMVWMGMIHVFLLPKAAKEGHEINKERKKEKGGENLWSKENQQLVTKRAWESKDSLPTRTKPSQRRKPWPWVWMAVSQKWGQEEYLATCLPHQNKKIK
jgi:hypothetical protein